MVIVLDVVYLFNNDLTWMVPRLIMMLFVRVRYRRPPNIPTHARTHTRTHARNHADFNTYIRNRRGSGDTLRLSTRSHSPEVIPR